jgi:hypothetical protein
MGVGCLFYNIVLETVGLLMFMNYIHVLLYEECAPIPGQIPPNQPAAACDKTAHGRIC